MMTEKVAPTKIFLVEDHPMMRQGISVRLSAEPDLMVCGEAEKEAESALRQLNLDLGQTLTARTAELRRGVEQINLLSQAIAHLGEGVMITDGQLERPGPHFLFVNEAFSRITGYSSEEVIGRTPRLLQGEKTDRETLQRIKSELRQGHEVTVNLTNYRKDGTPFDAELFITPLLNKKGECTHFVSVNRDVSDRKRAEAALHDREERLRAILSTASDSIISIDERGIITDANPATERMFGYSQEELHDGTQQELAGLGMIAQTLLHTLDR